MEDLIACLYPYGEGRNGHAHRTVNNTRNSSRLVDAESELPELQGRNSRESTAPLDESADEKHTHYSAGLQLTFTHGPKAGPGFIFGTDANSCDIVLPPLKGISRRHCYLTFDSEQRVILRDCSTNGTIVEYDGKGVEKRRHFPWILGGHKIPDETKIIVAHIHSALKFQIVIAKPTFPSIYYSNVQDFLEQAAANASLPLGALGIQSTTSTVAPSGSRSPSQDPILLGQETLGNGTFAVVTRVWDVSTGFEYASKRFTKSKDSDWRMEASLMRQSSHEHIVRLYFVVERPWPQLVLEYVPLGNLEDQHGLRKISDNEAVTTLQQGLSALVFLHEQSPPIVHRDIKPENILVQSRDPFHIKLGDFGLSKADEDLKTICGTLTYLPPELAKHYRSKSPPKLRYTHAVDIWSFGTVIYQYAYSLPHPGSGSGLAWCMRIVEELNDWESDDLIDLLSNMVIVEARRRLSARACLERASQLDRLKHQSTSTQAMSSPEGYQPLALKQLSNIERPTLDREVLRLLSSDASASTIIYADKRKRPVHRSTVSPMSSGRRMKKSMSRVPSNSPRCEEPCLSSPAA